MLTINFPDMSLTTFSDDFRGDISQLYNLLKFT